MNIKDFGSAVLQMSNAKRQIAIDNLKDGLEKETRWSDEHKAEIRVLVAFLESNSNDIADLRSYYPNS